MALPEKGAQIGNYATVRIARPAPGGGKTYFYTEIPAERVGEQKTFFPNLPNGQKGVTGPRTVPHPENLR